MSRAKVGYEFSPVPTDISPEWARLPFQTRMLGIALWMAGRGEPIPVPSRDWQTYLCAKLEVSGPDRPNLTRAMNRLVEAGLLVVRDGSATCLLRVCQVSATCLRPVCDVSAERKIAKPLNSPSTEEKRVEERDIYNARMREAPPPPKSPPLGMNVPPSNEQTPLWLLVSKQHAKLLGLSDVAALNPSRYASAYATIAAAISAEVGNERAAFEAAAQRLLGAWRADKWVQEHDPAITHLANKLASYTKVLVKPSVVNTRPEDRLWTNQELLAKGNDDGLDEWTKRRRWELVARAEAAAE